ncbi:DUF721 domain-containing protein [Primorskyibacter sp. 2E107]|uniref:DUF721 domain-containing protein n=1 Tax=Primorskyibacter sp. 2E107 TaxID=3403458 RepID=UPI003AF93138
MTRRKTSTFGFAHTAKLLQGNIRQASESRGFAQSRVLTHWAEIAGPEAAAMSRPVEISYGRQGFGATLTLLTTGAMAPMLEMQKEQIRARINAVYGYNAVTRVRITQTAAVGFAEGQADFNHRPKPTEKPKPSPEQVTRARTATTEIGDAGLRAALERLGANVLSKSERR